MTFIPHFNSPAFKEHIHFGPNQSFRDPLDVWKDDSAFRVLVSGFRCEDLILLHFFFQIVNDKMLKSNKKACLICRYQLKNITITINVVTEKKFFEQWV